MLAPLARLEIDVGFFFFFVGGDGDQFREEVSARKKQRRKRRIAAARRPNESQTPRGVRSGVEVIARGEADRQTDSALSILRCRYANS